jgi:hypothetical protein
VVAGVSLGEGLLLGEGEHAQLWCALAVDEHVVRGGRGVGEGLLWAPFFVRVEQS